MDYFKDNPRILCPKCKERDFRAKGIDKNGKLRTYTQCMDCTIKEWNEKNLAINKTKQ